MKKLLHIAPDEKFLNSANWQFEQVYPGGNDFFILVRNSPGQILKHVTQKENIHVFHEDKKSIKEIVNRLKEYDLVLLHSLDYFNSLIVNQAEASVKFVWVFWGYEVYKYNKHFSKNIYGNHTRNQFLQKESKSLRKKLGRKYYLLRTGRYKAYSSIFKAQKRVNYFCGSIKEEYDLFKKLRIVTGGYINWSYYPIEYIIEDYKSIKITGDNIMIGNSAEPSNNHLEVFELLKDYKLNQREVIVPLSYGDLKYAEKLIPFGDKTLGKNFNPLKQFYPLKEYNEFLKSCNVLIMNHYRQQGFGNIIAMLWMGVKVFFDERNVIYHYLKRLGLIVFLVEKDLKPENSGALESLSPEQVKFNRELIFKNFGKARLLELLKSRFDEILDN